jgi:hypothetical protein
MLQVGAQGINQRSNQYLVAFVCEIITSKMADSPIQLTLQFLTFYISCIEARRVDICLGNCGTFNDAIGSSECIV